MKLRKRGMAIVAAAAFALASFGFAPGAWAEGTLQEKINSASDGTTIVLDQNYTESITIPTGKKITLDLNGKELTPSSDNAIKVDGGSLTIVDSTASAYPIVSADYETVTYTSGKISSGTVNAVDVENGGTFTLKSGTIESTGKNGVYVGEPQTSTSGTFTMEGGLVKAREVGVSVITGSTVNIAGGVVVAQDNAALSGNGTNGQGDVTVNVTGGTLVSHIVTKGYIACGIYFPNSGTLNVSGGEIYADGGVGILARAGVANITGGTVVSSGTSEGFVGDNKNLVPCSGVVFDSNAQYPGKTDDAQTVISGNVVISSDPGVPSVSTITSQGDNPADLIAVSGGTFSDDSALKFAGDNVAFKGDDGFTVMTEEEALSSGAVASVATEDGTVYFATAEDAKDFAGAGEGAPVVKPVTWNVTFGLGEGVEGTAPTAQSVVNGSAATAPAAPERAGYKFLGWFTEGANEAYDFTAPVTSDLELTARWVKVWDVTFVFGTGADDMVVTVVDGTMVAAPEDPVYEGYTFVGWYTVMNEDGTLDEKSLFDFEGTAITEDLTLYGGWIEDGQEPEAPEVPVVEPEDKPAPEPDGGKLVQTGDASVLMMASSGIAGAAAIAAGYVASKRRK